MFYAFLPIVPGNGLVFGWKGPGQIGDKEYEKSFVKQNCTFNKIMIEPPDMYWCIILLTIYLLLFLIQEGLWKLYPKQLHYQHYHIHELSCF